MRTVFHYPCMLRLAVWKRKVYGIAAAGGCKAGIDIVFTSIILSQLSQSLTKTPELQQLLRDIPLLYRAVMHLAFSVTAGLP